MKRLLILLFLLPLISEAQMFGDIAKDTSRREGNGNKNNRKGIYIDLMFAGTAKVSGVSSLDYLKQSGSNSVQSSTKLSTVNNRSTRVIELAGVYRIKKLTLVLE